MIQTPPTASVFGGEKPGDIDYPASEDEAPDLTVDGTDSSEFAPAGFGIASASDGEDATPIFGSGGGALDVTAKMPAFTFGASLTVPYKYRSLLLLQGLRGGISFQRQRQNQARRRRMPLPRLRPHIAK